MDRMSSIFESKAGSQLPSSDSFSVTGRSAVVQAIMIRRLSKDLAIMNLNSEKSSGSGWCGLEIDPASSTLSQEKKKEVNSEQKVARTGWRKYIGMIMTLSASLNFSFGVLFAKMLQEYGYHGNCSSFWRYMGITVPAIPLIFYYEFSYLCKSSPSPPMSTSTSTVSIVSKSTTTSSKVRHESTFNTVWPLNKNDNRKTAIFVLLRGVFAAVAVILRYYALEYLPIGDTSVISYSTPVIVTILAHFFLAEKAGYVSFIIAITTLVGVVIVSRPPMLTGEESFTREAVIGTSLAVASMLCASMQMVLTRKVRSVHFALLTVTVGIIGLTIGAFLMLYFQDFVYPTQMEDGLFVAGLTFTSFFGQMSIILALKFEQAGPVALIRTSDVVIGFILQYAFLNVVPLWTSVVGGIIVVGGVLVTALRKWVQCLPEGDRKKAMLRWLLV